MEKFSHIKDIQRRIFAAMLANLDDSVGSELAKLRECDLEEETLVIFLSDNGGPTRELTSSNAPLRGGKGSVYEGGLRVPFMMQWKGALPRGVAYKKPVTSLDLFATSAAIAGAPVKRGLDGTNLLPYLTGSNKDTPHETLYWRLAQKTALRHGDWKLLRDSAKGKSTELQLYNLATDIGEQNDLSQSRGDKLNELLSVWKELDAEMIEPV